MLTHRHPPARAAAAQALATLGDQDDIGTLRTLFTDPDPVVRASAVRAVAALDRRHRGTPRRLRSPQLEPIAALLHDRDERVRRAAAAALGELGDRRAVPALHQAVAAGRLYRWDAHRPLRTLPPHRAEPPD